MSFRSRSAVASVSLACAALMLFPTSVGAQTATTYEIQVGQEFFEQGVPGFSARFYPGSIVVHDGDTIHFNFPIGLGPQGVYPQEHMGENDVQIGAPGSFFLYDPDEGEKALKANLEFLFFEGEDCGTAENPCVWGPNADVIFPAFSEEGLFVKIEASPGTTLWAASAASSDVNVNFKAEIVEAAAPASTQDELDARGASMKRKDYEDALALHARMSDRRSSHINRAGRKVYDFFVGASGGPIELFATYPRRTKLPVGARAQFHFMSQVEPHTATFGGPRATNVFRNFLSPACDPDGDEGTAPDLDATFDPTNPEAPPTCPEGTTLEGDIHPLLPWEVGNGKVTAPNDYENSGLEFPHFPDEGSFDVNPNPWTVSFPERSPDEGYRFICLVHGGFMGGRVIVRR